MALLEELPVDYFGFIFHPGSPRYFGTQDKTDLSRLFSTRKFRVGVFVNACAEHMIETGEKWNLSHIQLHGQESPSMCEMIRRTGYKVIRSFSVHPGFDFTVCLPYAGVSDLFLFALST